MSSVIYEVLINSSALHMRFCFTPLLHYFAGFLDEIKAICLTSWHMKSKLLFSFSPFFVVLVVFVAFVDWNGSVVLGTTHAIFVPS